MPGILFFVIIILEWVVALGLVLGLVALCTLIVKRIWKGKDPKDKDKEQ